ncbi:hypothetical protein, partial [uncultured Bifidobacterium sp.]|uniref:hypothetical protein n=1 Tax=uncultured Bifidobacterium sp. TaxID=165187 RepID=UPI00259A5EA7
MDAIAHDRLLSFRSGVHEEIEVRIRSAVIMVDGEITQQSGFGPDHHMVPSMNPEAQTIAPILRKISFEDIIDPIHARSHEFLLRKRNTIQMSHSPP